MFDEASWDDHDAPTDCGMATSDADGGLEALLQQAEAAVPTSSSVKAAFKDQAPPVVSPVAAAASQRPGDSVELGFVSGCPSGWARPEHFPSKVGGAPVWLHPTPPPASELCCQSCRKPLRFLMQLYCPRPEIPQAYHRSIMLFCCGGECLRTAAGWRAFRSNLGEDTPFYEQMADGRYVAHGRTRSDGHADLDVACSALAGLPELQVSIGMEGDWQGWLAGASEYSASEHAHALEVLRRFRESEQASDGNSSSALDEGSRSGEGAGASVQPMNCSDGEADPAELWCQEPNSGRRMPRAREAGGGAGRGAGGAEEGDGQEAAGGGATIGEDDESEEDEEDALVLFQRRVSVWPGQVLRYAHGADTAPLLLSRASKPGAVPPCSRCGAARWFEFQILPQLVVEIEKAEAKGDHAGDEADDAVSETVLRELRDERALDWGTVAVYSCSKSCALNDGAQYAYAEEICWPQSVA